MIVRCRVNVRGVVASAVIVTIAVNGPDPRKVAPNAMGPTAARAARIAAIVVTISGHVALKVGRIVMGPMGVTIATSEIISDPRWVGMAAATAPTAAPAR